MSTADLTSFVIMLDVYVLKPNGPCICYFSYDVAVHVIWGERTRSI